MSYLALARKWRPRRFEDVMGQGHVVKALAHALEVDKLHPAILLTGTRGVGKTTLARIVAKGLNCETGVSAQPCGVCSSCQEIDSGRSVDMLEIDAASNTGVDNVREIIDNAAYAPARSRYKVYLIDEVHMLSKQAFNALLKTLEEPPSHVKFILATTDPQKLLVTVLSRCLQFNLKRMPAAVIRDQLNLIVGQEGIEAEPGAMAEIARAADGSMRDGLSLLDQAIAFAGGGALQRDAVAEMLGTGSRALLGDLLEALAQGSGDALLAALTRLESAAPDYAALLNELAAALQRIAMLQLLPKAQDEDDDERLVALVPRIAAEDTQLWYQIAVNGRRDLPWAPDPRLGFEMTLLRMLAFRPDEGGGDVAARPTLARAGAGTGSTAAATATAMPASRAPAPAAPVATTPVAHAAAGESPVPAPIPAPIPAPVSAPVARTQAAAPPASVTAPSRSGEALAGLPWPELIEALELDGSARPLARQCAWIGRDGDQLRLALAAKAQFVNEESRRLALERALQRVFGDDLVLRIEVAAEATDTPAQLDAQRDLDRKRAAEQAIETDPVVRAFREQFGASVRPGSIQALDS